MIRAATVSRVSADCVSFVSAINQLSQQSNGDADPAARGSDSQMLTWWRHPGQGQPCPLGGHPRRLPPSLSTPLARGHSLVLQDLGQAGPCSLRLHTIGKSAGALERRGQAIPRLCVASSKTHMLSTLRPHPEGVTDAATPRGPESAQHSAQALGGCLHTLSKSSPCGTQAARLKCAPPHLPSAC